MKRVELIEEAAMFTAGYLPDETGYAWHMLVSSYGWRMSREELEAAYELAEQLAAQRQSELVQTC